MCDSWNGGFQCNSPLRKRGDTEGKKCRFRDEERAGGNGGVWEEKWEAGGDTMFCWFLGVVGRYVSDKKNRGREGQRHQNRIHCQVRIYTYVYSELHCLTIFCFIIISNLKHNPPEYVHENQ